MLVADTDSPSVVRGLWFINVTTALLGLLPSMLPFCGVFVFVAFLNCAQTAEDIDRISFAYNSPMSPSAHVKIWLTSVNPFLPKFSPKVTHPLLI